MNRVLYLALLALPVAGCSQQDNRICETPATEPVRADQCVHRQTYLMADAEGSISEIAKAAAHKCDNYITNDAEIAAGKFRDTNRTLEHYEQKTLKDAIQRVTEARSGNCDKPRGFQSGVFP